MTFLYIYFHIKTKKLKNLTLQFFSVIWHGIALIWIVYINQKFMNERLLAMTRLPCNCANDISIEITPKHCKQCNVAVIEKCQWLGCNFVEKIKWILEPIRTIRQKTRSCSTSIFFNIKFLFKFMFKVRKSIRISVYSGTEKQ